VGGCPAASSESFQKGERQAFSFTHRRPESQKRHAKCAAVLQAGRKVSQYAITHATEQKEYSPLLSSFRGRRRLLQETEPFSSSSSFPPAPPVRAREHLKQRLLLLQPPDNGNACPGEDREATVAASRQKG